LECLNNLVIWLSGFSSKDYLFHDVEKSNFFREKTRTQVGTGYKLFFISKLNVVPIWGLQNPEKGLKPEL
jgi:hypothetical protein